MAVYCNSMRLLLHSFRLAVALLLATCQMASLFAQDPAIDRVEVSNFRPGQKGSAVVHGKQLNGAMSLWTPAGVLRPKEGTDISKDQPVTFEGDLRVDAFAGIYPARIVTNHGCSEAAWVVVDDLPPVAITAEADDRKSGQLVTLPSCIAGQMNPVVSKFFRVALTVGQTVTAEVFSRRLSSELDPILRVTAPDGSEIAFRDDIPGAEGDTQLQFTAATDGEYRIELRDVRYSGGPRHFFHLRLGRFPLTSTPSPRIAQLGGKVSMISTSGDLLGEATLSANESGQGLIPVSFRTAESDASIFATVTTSTSTALAEAEPNNEQAQATAVPLESQFITGSLQTKGDVDWYRITATDAMLMMVTARTRELGSPTDVLLEIYKPDGGKLAENDDAGPRDAELSAQLPASGDYLLKVSEIAGRGGPEWTYSLELFANRKAVRVTASADRINVPRGGSAAQQMTVRRIHYDGPLKVEAVGLPSAVTMTPFILGSKQSTVPVVFTAADAAAASSDADWGPVSFQLSSPDASVALTSDLQLAPPTPKKTDAEIFRSARLRSDLFTAVAPAAPFSLQVDPAPMEVIQGATASVMIKSTRTADWTEPIEIALVTPADQLPPGVTIAGGSMAGGELAVTITTTADTAVGPFTVFLQGKSKKDKLEPVHPVPPIVVEIKPKS
jgi:hypothetical protein